MSTMPMTEEQMRQQKEREKNSQPGLISILTMLAGAGPSRCIYRTPSITDNVGNNRKNEDEDVRTVRRVFDEILDRPAAQRETDPDGYPLGMITQQMDDDIRKFQKENDLKVDGYLKSGGETIMAMASQLQKKRDAAQPAGPALEQKPAERKTSEEAIPAPPNYRAEVFKGKRRAEWEEFNAKLEKRDDLSPAERRIMRDIFAAEGGMDSHPDSDAFAGVLPSTLENHIKQGKVPGIVAKHGDNIKNTNLDADDLVEIYKSHLNDTMSSAIKGYNSRNPNEKVDATKLLGKLGDKLGGAVADTMFVNGNEGAEMIQNALNKYLPEEKTITVTPAIGSGSYQALIEISKDEKKTNSFIETLGLIRKTEERAPDISRIYYHRLNR